MYIDLTFPLVDCLALPEVTMSRASRMLHCPLLTLPGISALIALDRESMCISVVVTLLQLLAELDSGLQRATIHLLIACTNHVENLAIEFRFRAREGGHGHDVVVNTRVD